MSAHREKLVFSLVAVVLGFAVGALIIVATGRSPGAMFSAMFQSFTGLSGQGFNARYVGEFFVQAMPIILTGLSIGFAYRTGLFNIGAEGQFMVGALGATIVALLPLGLPGFIHLPLVLLGAMAAGAAWAAVPGLLKAIFNVHEVVIGIMMNYVAFHLNNWVVLEVYRSVDRVKTPPFPASALLEDKALETLFGGSRMNWGFVPVILALACYWFVINKTSFGYGLRAVGFNKEAARYAGMKVERNVVASMAISGAFAALAGAVVTVGVFNFGRALPAAEGYGFDGIAVALVGGLEAGGILLAGLLFGMLKAAGPLMQIDRIPKEIGSIISSSIVFFVAIQYGIKLMADRLKPKRPVVEKEELR
jgi:simple sugar transport system permease protein